MSNKIKCTCGHSWNKSSSSKKDMNICHICGKDNTMKNGGWLDSYDEELQLGGFVYPTNYVPQAQNGIEGTMGGLTDKGFNYNGAWGGQFQDGGNSLELAKMRSKMALAAAFGNPSAMRMTSVSPSSYRFSGNEMIDGESAGVRPGETGTHFMSSMGEYAVPYIQEGPNGKLRFNSNASFRDREAIRFDNPKDAEYFAKHYKEVAPMMKRYAMGGSMPGAVGFTYARTQGIPSEGPYAKKTKASAQDGEEVEYKELPEITVVGSKDKSTRDFYNNLINKFSENSNSNNPYVDQEIMGNYLGTMNLGKQYGFPKVKTETKEGIFKNAKGHYNPLTKTIYGNDPNTWVSEMAHHVQMKDNIVGKGLQWLGNDLVQYLKRPALELMNTFKYGTETYPLDYSEEDFAKWVNTDPYEKKGTVEHEAHREIEPMLKEKIKQSREKYTESPTAKARRERFLAERKMQNGGEMKFYQEGLDWKPRNISRNGSEIPQAQLGLHMLTPDYNQVGENIMEMLSIPQKALTKLFSGKYQAPSEALGIKNKVGAIATDILLDPANLVGGTGAAKIAKGVKAAKAANSVAKKVKPNFKSEIDWAKWNKEIPENTQLINEYNAIEQSTKKAGTWMKNADGSNFKGTPEQFIQMNSKNFKKAFPNGVNKVYRGVGPANNNPDFSKGYIEGDKAIFTADKDLAQNYAWGKQKENILTPFSSSTDSGIYELGFPKGDQINYNTMVSDWTGINLAKASSKLNLEYQKKALQRFIKNYEGSADDDLISHTENRIKQLEDYIKDYDNIPTNHEELKKMRTVLGDTPSTDEIAAYLPNTNLNNITLQNVIDGGLGDVTIVNNRAGNYLKSLKGNNGMFDMTNPNIYKSILPYAVPAAIGAGALQQKKQGGDIKKDDNGYWNPENWGEPVEIGSNEITMQGVYEPLLGISDTGDTQMMYPGEDYKFKGKKVTEYPVAQEGIKTSAAPYFKSAKERDAYRQRLKEVSEQALGINSDEDLLIGTSYHNIDEGNNCINGVCGLNRKAGITYNKPTDVDRFLSGEKFAQAVAKGDEDYYQVDGNFQIGDHMMYRKKKGSASHNKIIYDSFVNDQGEKVYKVIDNAGGKQMKTDNYTESELKKMQLEGGGGYDKVNIYRPGYSIDKPLIEKERAERTSPEARKALADRAERTAWETSHNPGYKYSIRKDSEYYDDQPEGMQKFIEFANDDKKINALVEKLGVDKGIIHDELLNTFGELGQENKWEDRTFGGTGGIENTIEKIFKPKSWSIGPGQIKFDTIDPELKQKFNIEKPKDLYDFNKIIPLMTAINIKNRKWMENQGDDLSTKLIGKPGVGADELEGGVGRWTPYMYRGKLSNPVSIANEEIAGSDLYGQELTDKRNSIIRDKASLFDKGSYASNVFENVNKNLERTLPGEYFYLPQEMQPITVTAKKKKNGGWLDEL